MIAIVFVAIIAMIGIGLMLGARLTSDREIVPGLVGGGVVCILIAATIYCLAAVTTVSANSVGVVTAFGRYHGTIPSGLHLLAPWDDVEEFGTRRSGNPDSAATYDSLADTYGGLGTEGRPT